MARPKKIQRLKIQSFLNASTSSWRVTGTMPDGRRIRKNFEDKIDAVQHLADLELEIEGHKESRKTQRTLLTAEQLADAESAIQQLNGISLSGAISHYLNMRSRASKKGADLDKVISFFETSYRPQTIAITILNAKEEFLTKRQSIRDATRRNYDHALSHLLKQDPNKQLDLFTVGDIEASVSHLSNVRSKKSFFVIYSVFFGWAQRHHYCLENPCKRLDKLPKDMSQIVLLSFEEARRLLYAAIHLQDAASAATIAIGLFAGLRPSEIKDLKPEDIGEKVIRVSGGKMRRKLKRTVPISPVLAAWLKKYPFTGLPGGWDYKMKALKKATKAEKWVQDIIRHTSITFQTERDKNEALTAYNCGTSVQMMNLHYRNTIDDRKLIQAFWDLTPAKLMAKKPEIDFQVHSKVLWPEKNALSQLVWEKPLIHAASEIGVSNVALKKHCIKLGLTLPPRGHWIRK